MSRPRLLDLFCGAGGAAMGYHRAGFDVVGVDIKPQPNYPFEFVQGDALGWWLWKDDPSITVGRCFDAIHASPPCQAFTSIQAVADNADEHPDLIAPTRELLEQTGLPYVIENVIGAPLREGFRLCGSSFGLGVPSLGREIRRHRMFETNWPIGLIPQCAHRLPACGIYGDHFRMGRRSSDGEFSGQRAIAYGRAAMHVDWMQTWDEIKEAIPPAMTEFIGEQLLAHVTSLSSPTVAA